MGNSFPAAGGQKKTGHEAPLLPKADEQGDRRLLEQAKAHALPVLQKVQRSVSTLAPTKQRKDERGFGFSEGDTVSLDAKVVGFGEKFVKVEFKYAEGSQVFEFLPSQLRPDVGESMLVVLQIFCGYLDIWFLRETFGSKRSAAAPAIRGAGDGKDRAPDVENGASAAALPIRDAGDQKDRASYVENGPSTAALAIPDAGDPKDRVPDVENGPSAPREEDRDCCERLFAPDQFKIAQEVGEYVEEEAKVIFKELNMAPWYLDDGQISCCGIVSYPFGKYLRYVLNPSVFFCIAHAATVQKVLGVTLLLMVVHSIWGFANLRTEYTDEEALDSGARAFRAVAHAPVTPLVLLLCTHLILMVFAARQVQELFNKARHLPFPLTYPMIVGKAFMILRMVLAYSSGNLGLSIDYFVWQELLLIIFHGALATLVGDPSSEKEGYSYSKQLAHAFVVILCIDGTKTVVMFIVWSTFKAGTTAYYFNRLPSLTVQLSASVLIHAVLDLIQTFVSVFTMYIGRAFAALTAGEPRVHKPRPARSQEVLAPRAPQDELVPHVPQCELVPGVPQDELVRGVVQDELVPGMPQDELVPGVPQDELVPGVTQDDLVGAPQNEVFGVPQDELVPHAPQDELHPSVQQLLGTWTTSIHGFCVKFTLHEWDIKIPETVGEQFGYSTVYGFTGVEAAMQVRVPKGKVAGEMLAVKELRVSHPYRGYDSYDASTVASDYTVRLHEVALLNKAKDGTLTLDFGKSQYGNHVWTKVQRPEGSSKWRRTSLALPYVTQWIKRTGERASQWGRRKSDVTQPKPQKAQASKRNSV